MSSDAPIRPSLLRDVLSRPPFLALLGVSVGWVFLADNYWIFTVSAALILAINALGLMILVGWAREMSLAQAALLGTATYVAGWLYRTNNDGLGWPFLLAALVAIVFVGALSAVVALACVRLSGVYVMVLTLGLQFMVERVIFAKSYLTGGITPLSVPRPWIFGLDIGSDRAFYFVILAVLFGVLLLLARLRESRYGRSLLLVGSNRRAAAALGVSPWRYKMFAFALCGMLAGLAGVLSAPFYGTPPNVFQFTAFSSLAFLAIPVLAGFESLICVVIIGVLFSVAPQALESFKINSLILGGAGLVGGTLMGARGMAGNVLGYYRKVRRKEWRALGDQTPVITIHAGDALHATRLTSVEVTGDLAYDEGRLAALEAFEAYLPPRYDGEVALTATDVSLAFGGVHALKNVSITVPTGHLVGLIGPNGAGKSTLFDVVNGLKRPNSGAVELFGRDVTRVKAWDRAAMGMSRTFQANRINLDISVRDNLLSGAHTMAKGSLAGCLLGLPGSWEGMRKAEEAAWAVATLLEIDRHWDELAGALSFGNRRRVEIGRSLLAGPRLLLLDEPAAGLDPKAAAILFSLVKRLHRDLGLTVLLVEHYVKAVLENCDLIYVLNEGALVASGSPVEVATHPDVRSQYFGADFDATSYSLIGKV